MEAPQNYKNAGLANLIGGGLNLMTSLMAILSLIWVCIGIFWVIPAAASAYQAYVGWQMFQGQPVAAAKNGSIAGIVGGLFNFNIISVACGGFAFMQLGNDEVAGWLEQNGV